MCESQGSLFRIDKMHFIDPCSDMKEYVMKFEKLCNTLYHDDRQLFKNIKW